MSQLHVMVLDPGMKSTALLLNFVYNQVQETWRQLIRNKFFVGFSIISLYYVIAKSQHKELIREQDWLHLSYSQNCSVVQL